MDEKLEVLEYFKYEHLKGELREVSRKSCELAREMAEVLPKCRELEKGLDALLIAKDCFVRAKLTK